MVHARGIADVMWSGSGRPTLPSLIERYANRLGRTRTVWLCLAASLGLVGLTLLLVEGKPEAGPAGYPLAATVDTAGAPAIEAVFNTRVPIEEGRWKGIVIHHSGSLYGSAADLAALHRARGLHGLGHHFVIGNGAGAGDGELFVGYRWLEQLPGAHAAGPQQDRYNRETIGICLVGDGDRRPFTEAQMRRLVELVRALQERLNLAPSDIVLHRDIAATTSPGRLFPEAEFRAALLSGARLSADRRRRSDAGAQAKPLAGL